MNSKHLFAIILTAWCKAFLHQLCTIITDLLYNQEQYIQLILINASNDHILYAGNWLASWLKYLQLHVKFPNICWHVHLYEYMYAITKLYNYLLLVSFFCFILILFWDLLLFITQPLSLGFRLFLLASFPFFLLRYSVASSHIFVFLQFIFFWFDCN